ncbi:MAG: helix-turn-helix domain-containing protein [Burkholderiaceae bacterium]
MVVDFLNNNGYIPGMNWQKLITELGQMGLSQSEIGRRCGCSQSAISQLYAGKNKQPMADLADALRTLHQECASGAQTA